MSVQIGLKNDPVSEVLHRATPRVRHDESILKALRAMHQSGVNSVLVVDGEKLAGIFTERDLLNLLASEDADLSAPVGRVMRLDPVTLDIGESILTALGLMCARQFRNIPVMDPSGIPVGVVRMADILQYIAETLPHSVLNQPPRPDQSIRASEGA